MKTGTQDGPKTPKCSQGSTPTPAPGRSCFPWALNDPWETTLSSVDENVLNLVPKDNEPRIYHAAFQNLVEGALFLDLIIDASLSLQCVSQCGWLWGSHNAQVALAVKQGVTIG